MAFSHIRVHGISPSLIELLKALEPSQAKTVVSLFGNPYALPYFTNFSTLIMGYEDDPDAQKAAAAISC